MRRRTKLPPLPIVNIRQDVRLWLSVDEGQRHWYLDGEEVPESAMLDWVRGLEAAMVKAYLAEMPLLPGWRRLESDPKAF